MKFLTSPGAPLSGSIRVPGDKSISHRSIMFGSLAEGVTEVSGFLQGADSLATLAAFRAMGVEITDPVNGNLTISGVGLHGLQAVNRALDMGNSGTSMRLLTGILAGQNFDSELTGDSSLQKRPMARITAPLSLMGSSIDMAAGGLPPLNIHGRKNLVGIEYSMPMASAQVKSSVLLAGLYAKGETAVIEPAPTRDHTERMLRAFGYEVETDDMRSSLIGGGSLQGCSIDIPADISSATFFMVAASICPDSSIVLENVGINPTRIGVINILKQMGARLELRNERFSGDEPVADIAVSYAPLKGIDIPESQVPLAIDEFPALFVAAACAEGTTRLTGAEELRVKESDRIQAMADGLTALGIENSPTADGIEIQGCAGDGDVFSSGTVNSLDDHRIAMAFAVAGLRCGGQITILDSDNVATSFPNFVELAQKAGFGIEVIA